MAIGRAKVCGNSSATRTMPRVQWLHKGSNGCQTQGSNRYPQRMCGGNHPKKVVDTKTILCLQNCVQTLSTNDCTNFTPQLLFYVAHEKASLEEDNNPTLYLPSMTSLSPYYLQLPLFIYIFKMSVIASKCFETCFQGDMGGGS